MACGEFAARKKFRDTAPEQDLPSDAQKEQTFLRRTRLWFIAIVPMRAAGVTVGSLAFSSFHEGTWSDKVIQQFRVRG